MLFSQQVFFYGLLDNIPNLNELMILNNKIKCNSFNTGNKKGNSKSKKSKKFSPILRIESHDNSIENTIFKDWIQFDRIKMKYIGIDLTFNHAPISNFIEFLKCSNLQYLDINGFKEVDGCNLKEFCNYLRNSQFLIDLKLFYTTIDYSKYDLLFQAISFNKSTKVLSFNNWNLYNCSFDLINLILTNQNTTTLILIRCKIRIDLNLIEALSKNQALLYVDLEGNEINEETASKLSNLKLKVINVKYCSISKESEELIYQKIPRKEFPWDLLSYENL